MAIALVNTDANYYAGTNLTVATSSAFNLTAGNTVTVSFRNGQVTAILSVTDSAGNVYRPAGYTFSSGSNKQEVWYCTNCLGSATNVISATYAAIVVFVGVIVAQWSSVAAVSPLDACMQKYKAGGADITSDAFTTSVANSVIIAFNNIAATSSNWTPDTGYTEAVEDASNIQEIEYKVVSSIQTGVTVTGTNANTSEKTQIVISLHEEISGGGSGEASAVF